MTSDLIHSGEKDAAFLADRNERTDKLRTEFIESRTGYYAPVLDAISKSTGILLTFNWAAAVFGGIWAAGRALWVLFWATTLIDLVALVLIGFGSWTDLGLQSRTRAYMLDGQAHERAIAAEKARSESDPQAAGLAETARALAHAADLARRDARAAEDSARTYLLFGIFILLANAGGRGWFANVLLERRFQAWRSNRSLRTGWRWRTAALAVVIQIVLVAPTLARYTLADTPAVLHHFPADHLFRESIALKVEAGFQSLTGNAGFLFDHVKFGISRIQQVLESVFVKTPWPVVMTIIMALAWGLAGIRVAIFTAAALIYLAVLGYWELSMTTVALLGTAAFLAISIGLPLGVLCGKKPRIYAFVRPVLDFMQTMPSFVYLIPIIALFGTGRAPAIIATLMFGVPPVVRLSALGIQGVPHSVREAATAFGATPFYLLTRVEIPLAMPSIMAGINQTILMSLAMVVVASLIGANGLGEEVLEALQFAAVGRGLLAGFAILFCAMVIDRIVQGSRKKGASTQGVRK